MRRRIWRISEDRFDDEIPKCDIAPSSISITGYEGQNIDGAFRIMSLNKVVIKGFVYSSNPYVICDKPEFEGTDITVPFHTMSEGFQNGDTLNGFFDITYNMGRKNIPFNFCFEGLPVNSSEGSIKTLEDFSRLCEVDFTEGMSVFYSKGFAGFMNKQEPALRLLYKGYYEAVHSAANLENFLEEADIKEKLDFELDKNEISFYEIEADQKASVNIKRTTWGRLLITIKCDAPFVEITKAAVNEGDFLGREYGYDFFIRKDKMHAGKNYGCISFYDGSSTKKLEVKATLPDDSDAERKLNLRISNLKAEIYDELIDFRVGKLELHIFSKKLYDNLIILYKAEESRKKTFDPAVYFDNEGKIHDRSDFENLDFKFGEFKTEKSDEEEYLAYRLPIFHRLLLCHSRILSKDRQKALWLIRDLKEDIINHNSFEWAYLLYLCIIIDSDEQYQGKLTDEIEKIFRMNPEDYRIFVFLLYLRNEYVNDSARKLKDIKQWIVSGYNCPILLAEAYSIFRSNPYLIQKMDSFTMAVLNFARKRDILTKDVTGQIPELLRSEEEFKTSVLTISEAGYNAVHSNEILLAIIEYLIRYEHFDKEASIWYRAGVDKELNVNGLYEAYLNSLPLDSVTDIPEQVLIYFRYPNNLQEDRKAYLFVNMISMKWKKPRLYNEYVPSMEEFALSQLQRERINENLTVIYQEVISKNHNYHDFAELIGPFMYIQRVAVLRPEARQVVLYQNCYRKPVVSPIIKGIAYLPVVDKDYRIFLVDADGTMTADESCYAMDPILHFSDSECEVSEKFKHSVSSLLHELTRKEKNYIYSEDEIPFIESILSNNDLDSAFLKGLYSGIYELLKRNGREDILASFFWNKREEFMIPSDIVPIVVSYGVRTEHFEEAYDYLIHNNGQNIGKGLLLNLFNYMIVKFEFNSNDFLLTSCAKLMMENFSSQQTIAYLGRYFTGSIEIMEKLLENSERESVINVDLAGRILIQLLYSGDDTHFPEMAFKIFLTRKPNRMVREAVLTFWSREYLLKGTLLPQIFNSELLRSYAYDDDVNESMRIALMRYLCGKQELSEEEKLLLDRSIRYYMNRNMRFGFLKDAPSGLKTKYHLYDKTYIEYNYESGKRLYITLKRKNADDFTEFLPEVYPGLYTKSLILFTGDLIDYDIRIDKKDGDILVSGTVSGPNYFEKKKESRYDRLNHMCYDGMLSEWNDLENTVKEYGKLDIMTKELLGIL